ncbi:MAG TPA: hypothetical protein VLQ93_17495, partial [Myxococcaceae bacterium]|nr:hypothetical protein [Myxococcaceae bacterium]
MIQRTLGSAKLASRLAAIETGLVLGIPEAWSACEQLLARREEGWAQAALLAALGGDAHHTAPLLDGLAVPELRRAAIWALGFSGWP